MFCPNCGTENSIENQVCTNCQSSLSVTHSETPSDTAKPKKQKKKIISVVFIVAICVVAVLGVLITTHVICIDHNFKKATCTNPKTCKYCGKVEGEPKGHNWEDATCEKSKTCSKCKETEGSPLEHKWQDATCTNPKICLICKTTEGNATGHVKTEWVLTKAATLVDVGVEEKICTVCNETIDSRGTEKKKPKVVGNSFNFNAKEFTEWLSENSTMDIDYTETDSVNSTYILTMENGTVGALLLNHGNNGKNGNVCAIMIYFEDNINSVAIIAHLGETINSNFSKYDAVNKLYYDYSYTKADMTTMRLDLDDGFAVTVLAPAAYVDEITS